MRSFSIFLPIVVWAGGLPTAAHALQTVELPGYENAWSEPVAPAANHQLPAYWTPPAPWLSPPSLDSVTEQGAAFVFVGAVDPTAVQTAAGALPVSTPTARVDVSALLDEVRLEAPKDVVRRGWLGQLAAALVAVGLVARRRLLVR